MKNKTVLREACIIAINKKIAAYKKTLLKVDVDYLPGEYADKISKKELKITDSICKKYKLDVFNISKIREFDYKKASKL